MPNLKRKQRSVLQALRSRSLRDRSRSRPVAALLVGGLVCATLASCGSDSGDDSSFTIALIEPDLTTVPLMEAAELVKDDGFDAEMVELAEPELAIEGLARGDYAISAEATSPALLAIEQDAPIRIIADVIGNQWAVYGSQGVSSCDDLVNRPVGIFSEGAVATAMVRDWAGQECTSGEPEYLTIGGSDVRAQALMSGQIDATALEISDVVTLTETTGADFHKVVDFRETQPELHPQTVYANTDFLENSHDAAQAFVDALVEVHAKINEDPDYLVGLAKKHLGSDDEALPAIAQEYVDAGLFDAGALTPKNVQSTIDFFTDADVVGPMKVEDVADLSFLP